MDKVKSLTDITKKIEDSFEAQNLALIKEGEQLHDRSKILDWSEFSLAYIRFAELGCQYLLSKSEQEKEPEDSFLIAAVLYNFKHGLEMIIKMSLKLCEDEGQEVGNKAIHDLRTLYKYAEKVISKRYLKSDEKVKLKNYMDTLYRLTHEYYQMNIIKKYLTNNFTLLDKENTLFKYPENSVGLSIDYCFFLEKINEADIKIIEKDTQKAKEAIYAIFMLLHKKEDKK